MFINLNIHEGCAVSKVFREIELKYCKGVFFKWSLLGCAGRSFRRRGCQWEDWEWCQIESLKKFDFFISDLVPSQVVIITEVSDVYVKDEKN